MRSAVFALVLASAGCGGATPPLHATSTADAGAGGDAGSANTHAGDLATSLDALAARGATEAPLMRELMRLERVAASTALARADRDLCVRVVFSAPREIRAWFADESGTMRGEAATGASGTVPPRGPACARKGEVLRLVIDGGEASARAVIFAAP